QSAVSVEIDQVAVAGRDAGPGEYAQARVFGVVDQQWLVDDAIEADIPIISPRGSVAAWARQRHAVHIDPQIAEALRVPPAANAVSAVLVGVAGIVANFAHHPRAVAGPKGRPRGVAQLRTADP